MTIGWKNWQGKGDGEGEIEERFLASLGMTELDCADVGGEERHAA
jgi:hypothetical protein